MSKRQEMYVVGLISTIMGSIIGLIITLGYYAIQPTKEIQQKVETKVVEKIVEKTVHSEAVSCNKQGGDFYAYQINGYDYRAWCEIKKTINFK